MTGAAGALLAAVADADAFIAVATDALPAPVVRFLLEASPHPVERSGEPMPLAENALRDSGRSGDVAPRAR